MDLEEINNSIFKTEKTIEGIENKIKELQNTIPPNQADILALTNRLSMHKKIISNLNLKKYNLS